MLSEHFNNAIDSLYNALGVAAIHSNGAVQTNCLALLKMPDGEYDTTGSRVINKNILIEVRKSEVSAPARGHTFTIVGQVYTVHSTPEILDPIRLVWQCHCRAN